MGKIKRDLVCRRLLYIPEQESTNMGRLLTIRDANSFFLEWKQVPDQKKGSQCLFVNEVIVGFHNRNSLFYIIILYKTVVK